ncbi:MAG: hypothetical protein B6241_06945 [Spirochaetaceae bacterium 4572_59]|nr:MAG: hypothetical protein B6241_06945 [Spirochaetaceae bacterium 4572_59]
MEIYKELVVIRNLMLLMVGIVALFLMKTLSGLILPLFLALILSIIYLPLVLYLEGRRIPGKIIVPFIAIFTVAVIYSVANIFIATITDIVGQMDFFVEKLTEKFLLMSTVLSEIPYLNLNTDILLEGLNSLLNKDILTSSASSLLKGVGNFGSSFLMFTLYFLFLLPGLSHYQNYVRYVGGNNLSLLDDIETLLKNVSTYMGIKMILSLTTGIIAGFLCKFMGLKFAFFWGFLTFILNFIPSIGSIIATLIPSLFGLIQFDSFKHIIIMFMLLFINQIIIGNFIDPKIMGNRLRLNTVTVLFGLVFWGVIWGIPGMLMSVPLMVTLKLLLEKSHSWSPKCPKSI